jgi:hypothetical protein
MRLILDKAIKAAGGREKIEKLRAITWKGKAEFEDAGKQVSLRHEGSVQGWDDCRVDLEIQLDGKSIAVLLVMKGDKIWVSAGGETKDVSKDREAGLLRGLLYGLRLPQMLVALAKDKGGRLSHLGELKVGNRDAVGLSISRKGRPDVSLFFDKKSGLPLKSSLRIQTANRQEKDFDFLFTDYKDYGGLKHFTKITIRVDGQDSVAELSELQAPGELDASLFDRP